jgi:uncharacterized protein YjlB
MNITRERTEIDVESHLLRESGNIPNNPSLPLLVYRKVIHFGSGDPAEMIEALFRDNGWSNSWRNGIFRFHHYHSNTHEVLGIYRGIAKVQLGGENGIVTELGKGDVVVIPAGVGHKNIGSSGDFACVGAYPDGYHYDMNYGKSSERPAADENIRKVPVPGLDPVYGHGGPVPENWHK